MTSPALPHLDRTGPHRLLFVMATDHEYGPALRARIRPLITGVGPIEAAAGTAAALAALAAAGELPDAVVSLGSAGSRRLALGEVYQVGMVSWRDIDASPLGFARGDAVRRLPGGGDAADAFIRRTDRDAVDRRGRGDGRGL